MEMGGDVMVIDQGRNIRLSGLGKDRELALAKPSATRRHTARGGGAQQGEAMARERSPPPNGHPFPPEKLE